MPSPTSRLRLLKQAPGSNFDSWGVQLHAGALDRTDEAFGLAEITVGADVTLDVDNYLTDEARRLVLHLTGAGGFTVTTPAVDKPYLVVNDCSANVTITPSGGTGVTVRAGVASWVWCDGTDAKIVDTTLDKIATAAGDVALGGNKLTGVGAGTVATDAATLSNRPEQFATPTGPLAMGGQKITDVAAGTVATDAATLGNRLDQFAAPTSPVAFNAQKITGLANGSLGTQDATPVAQVEALIASATVNVPAQTGNAGKFLSTDGTTPAWETRTLTAGTGLTGGGDLTVNLTFDVDKATDANLHAGAANKIVDAAGVYSASAPVTLTDGATITPDFNAGRIFMITLGGNRTLANADNQVAGQSGIFIIKQDGAGSRTLSYGANYKFAGGAPDLSETAGAIDVISYYVEADGTILCTFAGAFA